MSDLNMIYHYLRESGLPETKFGRLAVRDPRLVGDVRRGRKLGAPIRARLVTFMAEYRP